MNVLDENVPERQRELLRQSRVATRQIGQDIGRKRMKDREIIPLLPGLSRPSFFTLDADFNDRGLCHRRYCLIHLDIKDEEVAEFVQRLLRHKKLNTWAKRMGCIVRASQVGISIWRLRETEEGQLAWH
jgi:hypothetical protein